MELKAHVIHLQALRVRGVRRWLHEAGRPAAPRRLHTQEGQERQVPVLRQDIRRQLQVQGKLT